MEAIMRSLLEHIIDNTFIRLMKRYLGGNVPLKPLGLKANMRMTLKVEMDYSVIRGLKIPISILQIITRFLG